MKKGLTIIKKAFDKLAACIVPTVPVLIGAGMVKVLLIIIGPNVLNIVDETCNTYLVLSFVAEAGYYFIPIYSAFASAEVFDTDKYLAALAGAILLAPSFISLVNAGQTLSIYGLPIASTTYGNQVLPSIFIVFIESYIYKYLNKIIPENMKGLFVPLLTILIIAPIGLCAIGPIGVFLCEKLVGVIVAIKNLGPIGNGIMVAIIPYITMFGLGGANLSAMLMFAATGVDPILFFSNVIYNNILGCVCLAIYLKNKKPDVLAASIASAIGGTSEPAIYGVAMKDYKALISVSAGGFVGGLLSGIFGVKSYAMASFGTFGIIATIGPDSSIIYAAISLVGGCVFGFILSYLLHNKEKNA